MIRRATNFSFAINNNFVGVCRALSSWRKRRVSPLGAVVDGMQVRVLEESEGQPAVARSLP